MVTAKRTESEFAVDKSNDPIVQAEIDNFEREALAWRAGEWPRRRLPAVPAAARHLRPAPG